MSRSCRRCLLPAVVPGADLDAAGVCVHCRSEGVDSLERREARRRDHERDLEQALRSCRGRGEYDCLVSFSGGKDSVYLLHKLVTEYRLRVLAYTSNFDVPPTTQDNIRRTIEALGVDHISYTPPTEFYRRFIRYLLQHQRPEGAVHTVCYFWLDVREGDLLRLAVERGIPLVLSGYAPGQPDPARMEYEMPRARICEQDWTPRELFDLGLFDEAEASRFWNPHRYPAGTEFPRFLAPFHAWKYDQREVTAHVVQHGLVKTRLHANPVISNFRLNWLFVYSDLQTLGYNPYLPEFAQLIREGRASARVWRVLFRAVDFMIRRRVLLGRNVTRGLEWLGMELDQLRVAPPAEVQPTGNAVARRDATTTPGRRQPVC